MSCFVLESWRERRRQVPFYHSISLSSCFSASGFECKIELENNKNRCEQEKNEKENKEFLVDSNSKTLTTTAVGNLTQILFPPFFQAKGANNRIES